MSYKNPPSLSWKCACGEAAADFRNYEDLNRSQIDHARSAHRGQPWTITNERGRVIWRQGTRGWPPTIHSEGAAGRRRRAGPGCCPSGRGPVFCADG